MIFNFQCLISTANGGDGDVVGDHEDGSNDAECNGENSDGDDGRDGRDPGSYGEDDDDVNDSRS